MKCIVNRLIKLNLPTFHFKISLTFVNNMLMVTHILNLALLLCVVLLSNSLLCIFFVFQHFVSV